MKFLKLFFILSVFLVLIKTNAQDEKTYSNKAELMTFEELMKALTVVSGSKTEENVHKAPATIRVISSQDIADAGYLTLEDALADLPGFQFRNIQGFNSYVFQRGIPSQNNLILLLVDGVQINELNSGGFYGGGQFNLANVEKIEVVYGPASALYGTNALSGIINIITYDGKSKSGFDLQGYVGSFDTYNASLGYGYYDETNDLAVRISGAVKTSEKADLGGENGDFNWSDDMENFEKDYLFDGKVNYKDFILGFNYQRKDASRTTNYKSEGTDYLDDGSSWNVQFINGFLKYNRNLLDELSLSSQAYYRNASVLSSTIGFVTSSNQRAYYRPNDLFGFETILNYDLSESINLIGGASFELENLAQGFSTTNSNSPDTKPDLPSKPAMNENKLFSFFLQGKFSLLPQLTLTLGGRYDNSTVYDQVFTPRASLVFNQEKLVLKLLYTQAFRAPKPWDYNSGLGNPSLDPEEMKSIEFAGSYFIGENSIVEFSLYNNTLENKLTQVNVDNGFMWDNYGEWKTKGCELGFVYKSNLVEAFANYTYNYSVDGDDIEIDEIAKHGANFGVKKELFQDFSLGLRVNYLGKRNNPKLIPESNNYLIDQAFVTNLNISYTGLEHFEFKMFVKNLFDVEYFHTSNRPPVRYRQPQRSINFLFSFRF